MAVVTWPSGVGLCRAETTEEDRKRDAARRRKKDDEIADKMRLLSEARQLVEQELERRLDGLERQVGGRLRVCLRVHPR